MTGTKLITEYLDKYFKISTSNSGFVFVDQFSDEHLKYNELVIHLRKIFGDIVFADGTVLDIFMRWFDVKKSTILGAMHTYLADCKVYMSPMSWVVYYRYQSRQWNREITPMVISEILGKEYDPKFIEYYFEKWKEKKVIEETEKNMRIF